MNEMLRKMAKNEQLIKRIMETYKETKNAIKIGDKKTEEFWTRNGVRQGCLMSPTLFNIYITDLEAELKKG